MDANDCNGGEGKGEPRKRIMACDGELPPTPLKSSKSAVSRYDISDARLTAATGGQKSSSDTPQSPLDLPHKTQYSPSHFSGAHHFVSNGGTYNNIFGNYVVVAEPSDADSQIRSSNGIIEGSPTVSAEDLSVEREIYKGRGYRLHAARMSGKVVAMKAYEGSHARERCSESARFNQKMIHPNIAHMIAVSPLDSDLSYQIFDGEYEGAVHDILGQALKKDLKQILTLGLQTVVGLSSGLDYLQDLKYPFACVGLDHFVILSCKGKTVISFDTNDLNLINSRLGISDSAEVVFHELCGRTFGAACKAHYKSQQIQRAYIDEFDTNVDDMPENQIEELDSSGPALSLPTSGRPSPRRLPGKLRPNGRRQELVWKYPTAETVVPLNDISHQFQSFLNAYLSSSEPALNHRRGRYTARTAHRCPGYNRVEITLTADVTRSAIVLHSSPIPHEICPVCGEVVKDTEVFNCVCGVDDDESMPTVRCTGCSEWHHRPCVHLLNVELLIFVCERCQKRSLEQARPVQQTHMERHAITEQVCPSCRSQHISTKLRIHHAESTMSGITALPLLDETTAPPQSKKLEDHIPRLPLPSLSLQAWPDPLSTA